MERIFLKKKKAQSSINLIMKGWQHFSNTLVKLKPMLYDESVINTIKEILTTRKQTISVAESVTAGHLQAALSSAIEASQFFQGGITAYNLGQKCRHLHVDPIQAEESDCVNKEVAQTMALSVANLFTCQYSIAITGYATKMPEKGLNDLYAYYAISFNNKIVICEKVTTNKERVEAQVDYTWQVLRKLVTLLTDAKSTACW
jgi:nicotinamide-nucleotide amidase